MKLDNVLLSRPGCLREIKLADFGLSDFYRPGATMRTNCGSISYLAPEVRVRGYARCACERNSCRVGRDIGKGVAGGVCSRSASHLKVMLVSGHGPCTLRGTRNVRFLLK